MKNTNKYNNRLCWRVWNNITMKCTLL